MGASVFSAAVLVCGLICGNGVWLLIVSPLLHRVAHGHDLTLKPWTSDTDGHVQTKRDFVEPWQCLVFSGDDQGRYLLAGAYQGDHGCFLGDVNQLSSRHSRKRNLARCS